MTDEAVQAELAWLGLDAHSFRMVSLLPLLMVAWADHEVQPEERRAILDIARGHGLMGGRGGEVLERWLSERPTNEVFRRGTLLFVHLAHQQDGLGAEVPEAAVDYTVDLCELVAQAAGGVFGFGNTVSDVEQRAIRAIAIAMTEEAEALRRQRPAEAAPSSAKRPRVTESWMALLDELGEGLPESF